MMRKVFESESSVLFSFLVTEGCVGLVGKLFNMGFVLWFTLAQILIGVSSAQAQSVFPVANIDVEPPLIEHEVVPESESDVRQTFVTTVVDDDELEAVSLFYRFENDSSYSSVPMRRISYSSTFIAHVETDPESDLDIDYYIQARDKSGNRTVRGYAFNPLNREILVKQLTVAEAEPGLVTASSTAEPKSGGKRTVLYLLLGVLAAGLIAGVASDAGGGGGGSAECGGQVCSITINVVEP